LEITEVATLTSDYAAALKGVDAVVHLASPGPSKYNGKELVEVSLGFHIRRYISLTVT
jgi:hypothetical protein